MKGLLKTEFFQAWMTIKFQKLLGEFVEEEFVTQSKSRSKFHNPLSFGIEFLLAFLFH